LYVHELGFRTAVNCEGVLNDEHSNFSSLSKPLSPSFFVNAELKIVFPYGCTVKIEERQAEQKQTDTKRKQEGRKLKGRKRLRKTGN
jgi:hypothetical protein